MEPFLREVAEDLVSRFGSGLQDCAIVFNNKRPVSYLQKYLADIIRKPFFSPSFYTIQEFFSESARDKVADFYLQFFTLHQLYNELLKEEGFAPINSNKFFPLAKIMLSDFNQIDIDLVDAGKLYRDLEDISIIDKDFDYLSPEQYAFLSQFWTSYSEGKHKKQQELFIKMWRRMPKLYHKFHTELKKQHYLTNGSVYRYLAETGVKDQEFINSFDKGKIIFIGFNALSKAESHIFKQLQDAGKALFYFDADPYYLEDPLQEAGLFLRKNIQQLGLINAFADKPGFMKSGAHKVDVYKVQGHSAQAKILNNILSEEFKDQDEISSTVVVLADESLLIPTLQTIPSEHEGQTVDLNVTMGFALSASSIFGLIDLWLNSQLEILQHQSVSHQNAASFLSHPLTGISQRMRNKIQTALLEENQSEVSYQRLVRQNGLFEVFYRKIEGPQYVVSHLLEVLDFLLTRLSNARSLKKIDAELFVKTIQELNRLHDILGKHIEGEEITFVIYLVQRALKAVSVPLSGDPLNGIQVMGLLETRNLNFERVVILGFNEGIIPKSTIGSSFIPDSLRRVYGLPVLENLDAISSYMVYRLLQRAKKIDLVYNSLTDESTSGEGSRILKQLAYESGFSFNYHELSLDIKASPRKAVQIDKHNNQFIRDTLRLYLDKRKMFSPSALTQYISNPIDFFFNYIAGIKEPKEVSAVVEANEIGSILHKAMEYFYQELRAAEITAEHIKSRRKKVPQLIQRAFSAVMFKAPEIEIEFKGMQKVVLAIVDAYVNVILDQDEAQTPFTILSLEQKVEAELAFPVNGKEESVKIFGYIDRVDLKQGVTKIIDYKTGSDKLVFKDVPELFNSDGKYINKALVQTLIYTYAYEQFSGRTCVEPNLYVVKTMSQDGVWFKTGRQHLNGAFLEEIKPEFLMELRKKLTELFEAPFFRPSLIEDNYRYSIYKTLFGK